MVSVLVVAPDSGVASFAVIIRLVGVVIFFVVISRMHVNKVPRGGLDGLGWFGWSDWCRECGWYR